MSGWRTPVWFPSINRGWTSFLVIKINKHSSLLLLSPTCTVPLSLSIWKHLKINKNKALKDIWELCSGYYLWVDSLPWVPLHLIPCPPGLHLTHWLCSPTDYSLLGHVVSRIQEYAFEKFLILYDVHQRHFVHTPESESFSCVSQIYTTESLLNFYGAPGLSF